MEGESEKPSSQNEHDHRIPISSTALCEGPLGKIVRFYVDLEYFAPKTLMEIARVMSVHEPLIIGDNQFISIINEKICKCSEEYRLKISRFWEDTKKGEQIPCPDGSGFFIGPDWNKMPAFLPACERLCREALSKLSFPLHQERRQEALRSQEDQIAQASQSGSGDALK